MPCSTWAPASAELPVEAPPQGFYDDGSRVNEWIATGLYRDLAVVGLATRVASLDNMRAETVEHQSVALPRLLMVDVKWRTPIAGRESIPMIAAHVHNNVAKHRQQYVHIVV